MTNIEQEKIDINKRYPIELRKQNIIQFAQFNSNQDGIDLRNLYVGHLIYVKDEQFSGEEETLANRVTIVYLVDNLENDILYMDLFKERLYEKTTYVIPGILSFAPFTRKGLTIEEIFKISDLLNLERMQIEELENFYKKIENINYYDFLTMFQEQIMSSIEFKRKIKKEE